MVIISLTNKLKILSVCPESKEKKSVKNKLILAFVLLPWNDPDVCLSPGCNFLLERDGDL